MWKDPIVEEVHKAREKLMEECDNDPEKLFEYLCKQQEKHKDRLVTKEMIDKRRAEEKALS